MIGFKQDELCFSEIFCYQTFYESFETWITLKQKGFSKILLLFWFLYDLKSTAQD